MLLYKLVDVAAHFHALMQHIYYSIWELNHNFYKIQVDELADQGIIKVTTFVLTSQCIYRMLILY
jgi:hypothetical protein